MLVALAELRLGNEFAASELLADAVASLEAETASWAEDQRQFLLYLSAVASLRMAETNIGTGGAGFDQLMPNRFFRNEGGTHFADVTMAARLGHIQKGHAVAFADFDNDGDPDIFQQIGGAYVADKYADALYVNPGHGNAWISVRLVGTETNRGAIGARITVELDEGGRRRSVVRWVSAGGSYGGNTLTQLIGIAKAERVSRLIVHWPRHGTDQEFQAVAANQHIQITEGSPELEVRDVPRFSFEMPASQSSP